MLANISGYSNPDYDRLFAAFANELDPARRTSNFADVVKFAADNVVFMPFYYSSGSATISFRRGITGPVAVLPEQPVATWNVSTWDMN